MKIILKKETISVFTNEELNAVHGGYNTNLDKCGSPGEQGTDNKDCGSPSDGWSCLCTINNCPGEGTEGCGNNSDGCGGQSGGQGGGETGGGQSCAYC